MRIVRRQEATPATQTAAPPAATSRLRALLEGAGAIVSSSLAGRFTMATVLTATLILATFSGLIFIELENGLTRQARELEKLSDEKIAERLDSDTQLASARLQSLMTESTRRLGAIAQSADTAHAIASGNVVAMSELLGPAAATADLDAIIVVDPKARVVGAHSDTVDLLATWAQIKSTGFANTMGTVLAENDPRAPVSLVRVVEPGNVLGRIFEPAGIDTVAQISVQPFFDDFGEIAGALVGLRKFKPSEPQIEEFSRLTGTGIMVTSGNRTVTSAGLEKPVGIVAVAGSRLRRSQDGGYVARCTEFHGLAQVCALSPVRELYLARNELIRAGEADGKVLFWKLLTLGTSSLFLFVLISVVIARQVTRPLAQITKAVEAVADGDWKSEVAGTGRPDEVGNIARAVLVLQRSVAERDQLRHDVISHNRMLKIRDAELIRQNRLFDAALNNMSHGLCMFDADERLIVSNRRYEELYGLPETAVRPGTSLRDLLECMAHLVHHRLTTTARLEEQHRAAAAEGRVGSFLQELTDGRTIAITQQPMAGGGWVAIYEDVSERKRSEERIAHLARHDALTDLPNRVMLRERMDRDLGLLASNPGEIAVFCLDLDEFKTVNDSLGHPVGDRLLCQVADRLLACIDPEDTVVRLGGDEFAIVRSGITRPEAAAALARDMVAAIGRPYDLDGQQAIVGVSIGITLAPKDGTDPDDLLKHADLALYCAKSEGKNCYRFFEPQMEAAIKVRRDLELDLRQALENGEFEPYFQPLIDMLTGRVTGFEALLRWRHPERGMVPPAEFIPVAEDIGIIGTIGEWVLRQACAIAADWPPALKVAVNISPKQVRNRSLVQTVVKALAASGLPANRLELEITESVLLEENEETRATLFQLRGLGVRFSMDDFGTGYSSLSCLRSFPFDKIKIDQSFVRNLATTSESRAIVAAIVGLARNLGMETTAEGVETAEQVELLREAGCTEMQGYFFGPPRPADHVAPVLRAFGQSQKRPVLREIRGGLERSPLHASE